MAGGGITGFQQQQAQQAQQAQQQQQQQQQQRGVGIGQGLGGGGGGGQQQPGQGMGQGLGGIQRGLGAPRARCRSVAGPGSGLPECVCRREIQTLMQSSTAGIETTVWLPQAHT